MSSFNRGYGTLSAHQKPTVGDTKMSVASLDHMGWLLCDGRPLNVKEFYLLFSMIQYSFGGSGSTFNLPKAAGRVPGVVGQATIRSDLSGIDLSGADHLLGDVVGEEVHQLTMDEMPQHDHKTGPSNLGDPTNYSAGINMFYTQYELTGLTTNASEGPSGPAVGPGNLGLIRRSVTSEARTVATTDALNANNEPDIVTSPQKLLITDPTHRHQVILSGAGENVPHNTMQPTLFIGNMFIYSGKPGKGTYPYTTNTPYSSKTLIL